MQFRSTERCGLSLPALIIWWRQFWYGNQIAPINHFKDSNIWTVTVSAVSTYLTNCASIWHCFYQGIDRRMESSKLLWRQTFPFGFLYIARFFFFYCYQSLNKSFWCWLPFRSFLMSYGRLTSINPRITKPFNILQTHLKHVWTFDYSLSFLLEFGFCSSQVIPNRSIVFYLCHCCFSVFQYIVCSVIYVE